MISQMSGLDDKKTTVKRVCGIWSVRWVGGGHLHDSPSFRLREDSIIIMAYPFWVSYVRPD